MKYPLVLCAILGIGLAACSEPQSVFFTQEWNKAFHRRALESGDTLTIGAVFCDGSRVFVNDQAAGTIVMLDRKGRTSSVIVLEGIGRGSWCGDDFIVKDSLILFINGVDKRLERFSTLTGARLPSRPLPYDAFAAETKRSRRMIDRIELNNGAVFVGNAYRLVALERSATAGRTPAFLAAPEGRRFALIGAKERLLEKNGALIREGSARTPSLPPTHYAVSGKRLFFLDNRLYAVAAEKQGVRILEVK